MSVRKMSAIRRGRSTMMSISMLASALLAVGTIGASEIGASNKVPAAEDENSVTFHANDPAKWGRATRVVLPDYPAGALAMGAEADVSIKVIINILGGVKSITEIVAKPKLPEFETAVRGVVDKWQFEVPYERACVPSEMTEIDVVLHFTVVGGEPKIFLTHSAKHFAKSAAHRPVRFHNRKSVLESVIYPRDARRAGAQANVYTRVTFDPISGSVLETKIARVLTAKGWERSFTNSVLAAMEDAKFEPMPEKSQPVSVCIPFVFRFSD